MTQAPGTRLEPGRLRPTRRMLVVPTLGLILWAAGANSGAGFLVILAGGLVASVPWAWMQARAASRSVRVARTLPARASAGEPVPAHLEVWASGVGAMVIHDGLLSAVGVVENPESGALLRTTAGLARGVAVTGHVTAEVADPFGLFRSVASGDVPAAIEVLAPLHVVATGRPGGSSRASDASRPRHRGTGSETDGTREYRVGDSPRAVHWRSSARRQELVVRQFVGDAAGQLRVTVQPGAWTVAALDHACMLAGSLAESVERAGGDVELCLGGLASPWSRNGRRALASLAPHLGRPEGRGVPDLVVPGAAPVREDGRPEVTFVAQGQQCHVIVGRPAPGGQAVAVPSELAPEAAVRWLVALVAGADA